MRRGRGSGRAAPGLLEIGALGGYLDLVGPLSGALHVFDDQAGKVTCHGSTGHIQVDGALSGALHVFTDPFAGTVSIGSVSAAGDIYADHGISAALHVDTDFAGTIRSTPPYGPPGAGLSGSLWVGGDFMGLLDLASDLSGAVFVAHTLSGHIRTAGTLVDDTDPNDPNFRNAPLVHGHILVHEFQGQQSEPATIELAGGPPVGPLAFIVVGYGEPAAGDWDPNTAYVQLGNDPNTKVYGNTPEYRIWDTRMCRGMLRNGNDDHLSVADLDAFVEALALPQSYAHDYPGLGALGTPWDAGGTRL